MKDLDALGVINHMLDGVEEFEFINLEMVLTRDLDKVKKALLELKAIKEANSSEALNSLKQIEDIIETKIGLGVVNTYLINIIEQALLKAQDNEDWATIIEEYDLKPHEVRDAFITYKMFQGFNKKIKDAEMCFEAIDILKENGVNIGLLMNCRTLDEYQYYCPTSKLVPQEFDLLKRIFKIRKEESK